MMNHLKFILQLSHNDSMNDEFSHKYRFFRLTDLHVPDIVLVGRSSIGTVKYHAQRSYKFQLCSLDVVQV